jgi:hypothetical protein
MEHMNSTPDADVEMSDSDSDETGDDTADIAMADDGNAKDTVAGRASTGIPDDIRELLQRRHRHGQVTDGGYVEEMEEDDFDIRRYRSGDGWPEMSSDSWIDDWLQSVRLGDRILQVPEELVIGRDSGLPRWMHARDFDHSLGPFAQRQRRNAVCELAATFYS